MPHSPSVYRCSLRLLKRGEIEVARFISHRYTSLDGVRKVFEGDFHTPDYMKGVVELS